MKFKSNIISQGSGSFGGTTLSHNKGGMYLRSRAIPTNPNTIRQQVVRTAMAMASSLWSSLTDAQREGWNTYAANVPMTNNLGDSVTLSGQQHFIRSNSIRIAFLAEEGVPLPVVSDAPTTFDLGSVGLITVTSISEATQMITSTYDDTLAWVATPGSWLLLFQGRPQNAGIGYFKGPFRRIRASEGGPTPDPTPLETGTGIGFPVTQGQKVWFKAVLSQADGRLSPTVIIGPTIVGA